jgi:hypothetical protein
MRHLTALEKLVQELIKNRLETIMQHEEQMWKQRAKGSWVKFGDKNIKYFHVVASHQKRNNMIAAIQRGDQTFSDHGTKTSILFSYFCSLIGTSEEPMINFNFSRTYDCQRQFLDQQNWEAIQASISEEEIKVTIDAWAHNN